MWKFTPNDVKRFTTNTIYIMIKEILSRGDEALTYLYTKITAAKVLLYESNAK